MLDKCFYCDNKTIVTGTPRTDKLIIKDEELKKQTYKNLGLSENDYLVLYAPTFRNNQPIEACFLDNDSVINSFSKVTNKNVKILYRFHPNIANKVKNIKLPANSINVTDYFDIQDLIMVSDVMITDFSSCAFDMMLANKPTLIFSSNTKQYLDNERGLYFSTKNLPFPIAYDEKELYNNIAQLPNYHELYNKKIIDFSNNMGIKEKGNASEQIYNLISEIKNKK
ncbi:MAG: CDP-glycerol glycerophosphotransferase family protein [Clostridia bacterium]|nr:CDP-glycerol glycerophosphotransferase family protein [Clostridia bacterium]